MSQKSVATVTVAIVASFSNVSVSITCTDVYHLTILMMLLILSVCVKDIIGHRDGYFSETEITGLQEASCMISGTFQSELDNSCIELMEIYLCHYYLATLV